MSNPLTPPSCCYWFTGLSGAGKTTLASHICKELEASDIRTILLDGDRFRQGLNKDLGFSREDRRENVRRIAEVARMLVDSGFVVLVSAIAPYQDDRQKARDCFAAGDFFEVYVNTDLQTCAARDTKGLYARARAGEISRLTGWDDPYEAPVDPDFSISTINRSVSDTADILIQSIVERFQIAALRRQTAC